MHHICNINVIAIYDVILIAKVLDGSDIKKQLIIDILDTDII